MKTNQMGMTLALLLGLVAWVVGCPGQTPPDPEPAGDLYEFTGNVVEILDPNGVGVTAGIVLVGVQVTYQVSVDTGTTGRYTDTNNSTFDLLDSFYADYRSGYLMSMVDGGYCCHDGGKLNEMNYGIEDASQPDRGGVLNTGSSDHPLIIVSQTQTGSAPSPALPFSSWTVGTVVGAEEQIWTSQGYNVIVRSQLAVTSIAPES